MNRPNIIFYFTDQQRWDTMGCYGQRLNITPNLDKIAAEGCRFDAAFTCQPVCGPARACLQTGLWPTESGCFRNDIELPRNVPTLAGALNEAGYKTAYVGKWHLASNRQQGLNNRTGPIPEALRGGYRDEWMAADALEFTSHGYNGYVFDKENRRVDFTGYRVDAINNFAVDYIHRQDGSQPFFLFVSQLDPHHQNDHNRYEGPDGSKRRFADYDVPGDLVGHEGDWRQNFPDYLGQCQRIDENVGRMVDALKDQGLWENTIFIYTADHGSHFRTRNSEYKRSCHDGCTHIPLIIHGPGFNRRAVIKELVSLMDMPATILDLAGAVKPESFHGRSLRPLATGEAAGWENSVFMQISESQVGRAVRTEKWKYSVRAPGKDGCREMDSDVYAEDFLYNLEADPHEQNNLVAAPEYADVRAALKELLIQKMEEAGERRPEILPAQQA